MKALYTKWRETRQQEKGKRVPFLPRACCPWRAGKAGCKIHGAGDEQQCTNRLFLRVFFRKGGDGELPGFSPSCTKGWDTSLGRQDLLSPLPGQLWGQRDCGFILSGH